jgi:hypothetical protein
MHSEIQKFLKRHHSESSPIPPSLLVFADVLCLFVVFPEEDAGSHEKTKFMPSSRAPDERKAAGRVRSGTRLRSGRLLQRSAEAKAVRVPRGVKRTSTATLRKPPRKCFYSEPPVWVIRIFFFLNPCVMSVD